MWIRAVRLLNVKSFGTGPDGTGWRVCFDRGLNRLAGPNGAGKTSVIEALGYALFDARPLLGSRMDLDSALLRHGANDGEIEVEIENAEGRYRVRRGVGKRSTVRWTVRDESGFVTHEDETEVRRFLATSLGLGSADGLTDLYRKLLGVRQGRLLDPFELSPTEARKHFAPLLNVDIYQRCFAELAVPGQRLKEEALQTEGRVRAARAQSELLAGSVEEAETLKRRVAEAEPRLKAAGELLNQARATVAEHDAKAQAIPAAASALKQARKEVENAESALVLRRELLQRAEKANDVLQKHSAEHKQFVDAEKELAEIGARRPELEAERERLEELKQAYVGSDTRAREAQDKAGEVEEELKPEWEGLAARQQTLDERRKAFEEEAAAAKTVETPLDEEMAARLTTVEAWASALNAAAEGARRSGEIAAAANTALKNFDPDLNQRAKAERDEAEAKLKQLRDQLTALEAARRARHEMGEHLRTTKICPLLNMTCQQFEEGKLTLSEVNLDRARDLANEHVKEAQRVAAEAGKAAAKAEEEETNTRDLRVRVDVALTDLQHHLVLAGQEKEREAFARLAPVMAASGTEPLNLPDAPQLPDPGESPWDALASASEVAQALCVFASTVSGAAEQWRGLWNERQEDAAKRVHRRQLEEQQLAQEAVSLSQQRNLLEKRRAQVEAFRKTAAVARAQAKQQEAEIAELAKRQSEWTRLGVRARELEQARSTSAKGHHTYLAAQADAQRLEQARADVALALGRLEEARETAKQAVADHEAAVAAYDREAHAKAKGRLEEAAQQVSRLDTELQRDRTQLEDALDRADKWRTAAKEWAEQNERHDLLKARLDLLDHLRKALRDVGPHVAEQLVLTVNGRAQALYAALTPQDPGRLEWQPDYELRVMTATGARRFANLSGGQRVKAALALQVALVQQFSQAGICIFDEPTYALDAESRERLAEALVDVQRVAQFEQVIIVSHDDAFDEHAEHTVKLAYSPATGTSVVE